MSRLVRDELQPGTLKQKQELLAAWRCSGPLGVVGEFCRGLCRGHQRPEQHVCLREALPLRVPCAGLRVRSVARPGARCWRGCSCRAAFVLVLSLRPQQSACFAALKLQPLPQHTPACPRATEDSPASSQPAEPEGWPAAFRGKSSYGTAPPLPQPSELDATI